MARTAQQQAEVEVTNPDQPQPAEEENEVTRPSDLGFGRREIVVEPIEPPKEADNSGYVQVRMARTIEEFTFGNPHQFFRLDEGKIYRVPAHIGRYLHSLGALSNIA